MPVSPDPAAGAAAAARVLHADDGRVLARFLEDPRGDTVHADLFAPDAGVGVHELLPVLTRDLAGWRVSGPPELGRALVSAGGTVHRHSHVMRRDLGSGSPEPAPGPAGLRITPVDRPAADLVAAMMAAYPPGHPDHEPGDDDRTFVRARLERMISGVEIGPLLGCSRLAVAADGTVAGAALVCDMPDADAPFGGPWIGELFRDPDHPGAGRALLDRAIRQAAIDGLDALGLVVTEGNPARALYERTGFTLVRTFLNVDVPARTAAVGA